ncbi:SMI1/KNR4 family protein [Capnocytophaga sp. oral taxon 878]|uniref:SMI1/KNR4 family protein n=1 Tax=Capnocytophaga sp. oral taxon 878 TaxID=1316596 RepID=UPI000D047A3A|nr:SMI1/KNR4 family protein [Capnocytophaga sp. oral taxon 878]AVM50300.1 SMI1/KNR4 family protein [Capnocytophaga sp. oral taxon 878]
MKNIIKDLEKGGWNSNKGANLNNIGIAQKQLHIAFPEDYLEFLKWNNGGEGYIGENYISFWKVEDLEVLNREYQIQTYLSKGYLGIGTDGGGICYGFCLGKGFAIFKCSLGDLDIKEITIVANSIKDFFGNALVSEL